MEWNGMEEKRTKEAFSSCGRLERSVCVVLVVCRAATAAYQEKRETGWVDFQVFFFLLILLVESSR